MADQTKADKLKSLKSIDLSHLGKAEAKEFTVLLEELSKREFQEHSTRPSWSLLNPFGAILLMETTTRKWQRRLI